MRTREILGVKLAVSSYEETARTSIAWARAGESRAIMFANVHVIMEAHDREEFRSKLNAADMVNADGMPLVWALKTIGERAAQRVYGPDATEVLLGEAEASNVPVGFYGGSPSTLSTLVEKVRMKHLKLDIAFALSPPYRELTAEEDRDVVEQIAKSGARLLFVGLGCPKQEQWVMEHRGRVPAVMLAVGAAFDFIAGTKPQAPRWMMRAGLEWLFRFASEPRRLARRYLRNNPRFVAGFIQQWLRTWILHRA